MMWNPFSRAKSHHLPNHDFISRIKCQMRWWWSRRWRLDNEVSWTFLILSLERFFCFHDIHSFSIRNIYLFVVTCAVRRPRFSLGKSVWLHDEFAHGAIVFRSSSNLQLTTSHKKSFCIRTEVTKTDYLNSLIWLCINFLMFHGRSLCPSIKGTCSRKWIAAW